MSEIAKCPICGGKPLDKWEVTSARVFQTGQMCCGVDCSTNERWNQYAAAMECQARHNALKEVAEGLRDALRLINSGDHEDKPHSVAGHTLHLWEKELAALVGEEGK